MKAILFALCFSCLLHTAFPALTFTVVSTGDTSTISTGSFTGGGVTLTTPTSGTAAANAPVDTNTYTGGFTAGIPTTAFSFQLASTANSDTAAGIVVVLRVGNQVSLNVQSGTQTTGTTAAPYAGTYSSATAGTPTSTSNCGVYSLDCAAGTITFTLRIGASSAGNFPQICSVQLTQVAAIAGILQYPTSSAPTTPFTTLAAAITSANSATSPTTNVCGSLASGSNTNIYFYSTYGTTTATADQTAAVTAIRTKAAQGGLSSNTAYLVQALPVSATGQQTAPSASAGNLATVNKSQSRMVAFVGIFTTAVATIFGLAL